MAELLGGWKRSLYCTELTKEHVGQTVTLFGWVQRRRDLGSVVFVWLRDRTGIVQLLFDGQHMEGFEQVQALRSEFVIAVRGCVAARGESAVNPKLKTGEIEVLVSELKILSEAQTPPVYVDDEHVSKEELRLKYRYLDLRRPSMQQALRVRHTITKTARDYLDENGFLEIETPMLVKSTPEGARDYLVPSRVQNGKFYALPQSPQLYKQLLMVSGFDRYFQIARCFRDEDLRADRQPEFTQIDIEMSFVDIDDVIAVNEGLIQRIFKEICGIEVSVPFKRMTYREAMDSYGSDKPDSRFGMLIQDISTFAHKTEYGIFHSAVETGGSVRALVAKSADGKISRKEIDALGEHAKTYQAKGLGFIAIQADGTTRSPLNKFIAPDVMQQLLSFLKAEPSDMVFIIADAKRDVACTALGQLRLELAKKLELIPKDVYELLWVTEFPLLEHDEEAGRYVAIHHPFTSPMDEDIGYLNTDPGRVRAKAYDIVLNGTELGGGSIRIHDRALQEKMFAALGFSAEEAQQKFGFLLEAFQYGPPPHGGIAYGLDRLCMLLLNRESIRDVIAFPKVQNASCPMSEAPSAVAQEQLQELGITLQKSE
ncbi:MAG: aspartate--tRNA ligase [Christensenellales bacterium]|jgi:aspartyl-tRNA synthetase